METHCADSVMNNPLTSAGDTVMLNMEDNRKISVFTPGNGLALTQLIRHTKLGEVGYAWKGDCGQSQMGQDRKQSQ